MATAPPGTRRRTSTATSLALASLALLGLGANARAADTYADAVEPILSQYCYGCHGQGAKKGNVDLEALGAQAEPNGSRTAWAAVLRNLRSGVMPPAGKPRPGKDELAKVEAWIKSAALKVDPADPDPGRVTIRRLNRAEYRNTIRDLMGIEYNTEEEFPADDTGYGFDTIGDVLAVSPLLLEKYLQAAESIVAKSVPTVTRITPERDLFVELFRGRSRPSRLPMTETSKVFKAIDVEKAGDYRVVLDLAARGAYSPAKVKVDITLDDKPAWTGTFAWGQEGARVIELPVTWAVGDHVLAIHVEPIEAKDKAKPKDAPKTDAPKDEREAARRKEAQERQQKNPFELRIQSVKVRGPLGDNSGVHPPRYEKFFGNQDPPPASDPVARKAHARKVIERFAARAFRRPVGPEVLDRLVALAESVMTIPGKTFEEGVSQAFVGVLASPRFLFRVEEPDPKSPAGKHPFVDEYALASRLSYFLWSTMPDDTLFDLARKSQLRANLPAQVERMLKDARSEALVKNFTGQWLQTRDVEGIAINARAVLRRDRRPGSSGRFGGNVPFELDRDLRGLLQRETEMTVSHVLKEDRPLTELIDADYTFLNERLAKHYEIPDIKGQQMRKVTLPKGSPRGGILTQGAFLIVTSNPTRTSPVKRGLFLLDNILGTPPPPPPNNVPDLDVADKEINGRQPSMRELMEIHRKDPLCNSCHSRMDPLGLAFENFNALGLYRETERGQKVDPAGTLITGEKFQGVKELKTILTVQYRRNYHDCLSEKLLTYAIGRGMEPSDVEGLDRVVARLESGGGTLKALISGVVESPQFLKRRQPPKLAAGESKPSTGTE